MVSACCVVINAFSVGRSASIAAVRESCCSLCRCTLSNARTDSWVPSRTCCSVSTLTVWRIMSKTPPVRPKMVSSVAKNSCVRSRKCVISRPGFLLLRLPVIRQISRDKLVSRAVNGQEIARVRRIRFQLLPQTQNVIVHRARGGVILIAPDLVQELVARKHSSRRSREKLQQLELLRRQRHFLSALHRLHAGEVHARIAKGEHLMTNVLRRNALDALALWGAAPHCSTHARQQFPRTEWLGHVVVGPKL